MATLTDEQGAAILLYAGPLPDCIQWNRRPGEPYHSGLNFVWANSSIGGHTEWERFVGDVKDVLVGLGIEVHADHVGMEEYLVAFCEWCLSHSV